MNKRLIVVGIDGMDAEFVEDHLDVLPNFAKLKNRAHGGSLYTVFPSDSIPSWVTIFTGIPPVDHGILDSVDYFEKDREGAGVDTSVFKGRSFWDLVSDAGRSVGVVNAFMAYPPWDVNGCMVSGPVFMDGGVELCTPASLEEEMPLPSMGGIVDYPDKNTLGKFAEDTRRYTLDQHEFSLRLMREKGPFDLFFSTYLTLDRIQHFYWRFHDEDDPTNPGTGEHANVVLDFYKMFDDIVGDYLDAAGDEAEILVLSDHGHGRRCTKVANVNEYLRRKGWVRTRGGDVNPLHPRRLVQKLKTSVMGALDRWDMTDLTHLIAKTVPKARELKKSTFMVDESKNAVFTPRFAGTNPCGGVALNRSLLEAEGRDYEQTRSDVRRDLLEMRDPDTGESVFRWVVNREDYVGEGAALEKFPDLVFLMKSEYGTGWDLFGELVAVNPTHRKISGGHKLEGVLYSTLPVNDLLDLNGEIPAVHDIAPLVLRHFGLEPGDWSRRVGYARATPA